LCGIAGIYQYSGPGIDRQVIKRMGDSIAHRGPDDDRYYFWSEQQGNELYHHEIATTSAIPTLGFAHRRLSIVDVKHGHQPMSNEDQTVWICYNGEVYNHLALRQRLLNSGHHFKTQSDTEALIHLYEEYGPECVKQLNGMFAFAIWDSHRQVIFLARDRFGIKPVYYTLHNGALIFASELKAI
jgi:asparagine synthase (glutamine-hydrolysing)